MIRIGMWCVALLALIPEPSFAQPGSSQAVTEELEHLVQIRAYESSDPRLLLRMSGLYLDAGKDIYTDAAQRREAYEEGARLAKRALDFQDANADAHYLYAASLGSAAQLKGLTASALTVSALKRHVARALALQKDHAPALHMMGRMLDELPWMLGGDADAALKYLRQAVQADPKYAHAHLDLAKAYVKRHDIEAARLELQILADSAHHSGGASRYEAEGRALLASLQDKDRRQP